MYSSDNEKLKSEEIESPEGVLNILDYINRTTHDFGFTFAYPHPTLPESMQTLIRFDGNYLREEVLNAVSHGLGIILCFVAAYYLIKDAYSHRFFFLFFCFFLKIFYFLFYFVLFLTIHTQKTKKHSKKKSKQMKNVICIACDVL